MKQCKLCKARPKEASYPWNLHFYVENVENEFVQGMCFKCANTLMSLSKVNGMYLSAIEIMVSEGFTAEDTLGIVPYQNLLEKQIIKWLERKDNFKRAKNKGMVDVL